MQPYFFPYIGYYSLIKNTDKWIVFDTVQYIQRGWMNRNRIIHPQKPESIYITVPTKKHEQSIVIKDIQITDDESYKDRIISQLVASYKKRAPNYDDVMELVYKCLNYNTKNLCELNIYCLKETCEYLNIPFDFSIFSEMNLEIDKVSDPGEWALNICKSLNADEYINPPGGIEIFDNMKFKNNNIELKFLKAHLKEYNQKKQAFIEGLSILDVMMFNKVSTISKMLDDFDIIKKQ